MDNTWRLCNKLFGWDYVMVTYTYAGRDKTTIRKVYNSPAGIIYITLPDSTSIHEISEGNTETIKWLTRVEDET